MLSSSLISKMVALLIGLVIAAVLLPIVFEQVNNLQGSVTGYCTVDASTAGRVRWAVGEDFLARGYFSTNPTTPVAGTVCTERMSPITIAAGSWSTATSGLSSSSDGDIISYIATATSNNPYTGIITVILQLVPVILIVGIIGSLLGGVVMGAKGAFGKGGAKSGF